MNCAWCVSLIGESPLHGAHTQLPRAGRVIAGNQGGLQDIQSSIQN
jgi:hypothetical protein